MDLPFLHDLNGYLLSVAKKETCVIYSEPAGTPEREHSSKLLKTAIKDQQKEQNDSLSITTQASTINSKPSSQKHRPVSEVGVALGPPGSRVSRKSEVEKPASLFLLSGQDSVSPTQNAVETCSEGPQKLFVPMVG